MNIKRYKQLRVTVAFFVALLVSISVTSQTYLLAIAATVTGILFLTLVRSKVKIVIDEREKTMREKAAQMTYAIFTPTIGFGALLLTMFARDEYPYLQSLGIVFSYLTLFLIALYSISFFILSRQMGGGSDEE